MPNTSVIKSEELVAKALRAYADMFCDNREKGSVEEGRALDRALRSCKGISDIDVVWVRWCYLAERYGWLIDHEMKLVHGKYCYVAKK